MNEDREPTAAELAGMRWWNDETTEAERRHWMRQAGDTGVAADAWTAFQAATVGEQLDVPRPLPRV